MFETSDATDGNPGASATVEPWDIDFCDSCGRPVPSGVTVCFECDAIHAVGGAGHGLPPATGFIRR